MIIISQDREGIVKRVINFDNTSMLGLDEGDYTSIVFEDMIKIGEYATEERAKAVLQEIIFAYKCSQGKKSTIGDIEKLYGKYENAVYEMPEN